MAQVYGNLNPNARVYFVGGSTGVPQNFQSVMTTLPTNNDNNSRQSAVVTTAAMASQQQQQQPQVLHQVATLPAGNLPSHYGQLSGGLKRIVVEQGSQAVQPQAQVVQRIIAQPAATTSTGVSTGCAPCAARASSMAPALQYVQIPHPNGIQGWYGGVPMGGMQMGGVQMTAMQTSGGSQGGPIIRTSDVIMYPTLDAGQTTTPPSNPGVEPKQEMKWTAASGESIPSTLRAVRSIGAVLALIGSLTVGLGIAGVVLYHSGKSANSGLSWCTEAHSPYNLLTAALFAQNSSPGINYVSSGAGILGLVTFIVGAMTMHLETGRGPFPNATMYLAIADLPILVCVAILSILSFAMTFRMDNKPPTCVPLTVVTFLTFFMALLMFILLYVVYCKMRANQFSSSDQEQNDFSYSPGSRPGSGYEPDEDGQYPVSKISTVRVNASNPAVQPCTCECCPCCMPMTRRCCGTCAEPQDKNLGAAPQTSAAATTTATTAAPATPAQTTTTAAAATATQAAWTPIPYPYQQTQMMPTSLQSQVPAMTPFAYPYGGGLAVYGKMAAVRPAQFVYHRI